MNRSQAESGKRLLGSLFFREKGRQVGGVANKHRDDSVCRLRLVCTGPIHLPFTRKLYLGGEAYVAAGSDAIPRASL